jgi:hypothetical protein
MSGGIQKCPICESRVLPSRDGSCPSCRQHNFDTGISTVPVPSVSLAARRSRELREGASLHWRHVWTTWAVLAVLVMLLVTRGSTLLYLATLVVVACHFYTARELRRWLGIRGGRRSFLLIRDSLAEFAREGVSTGLMGPRID